MLRWIALFGLKVLGWQVVGEIPQTKKFVLIAAPHTSNWDLLVLLAVAQVFQIRLRWLGKKSLFKGIWGNFMKGLGGIPVDRSARQNMVQQAAVVFQQEEILVLAIPPEGTRRKVDRWKSGFYYIALTAQVPIVCGFIDYRRKISGTGPTVHPTGNTEADMKVIREFYQDITPLYPEKTGDIRILPPPN